MSDKTISASICLRYDTEENYSSKFGSQVLKPGEVAIVKNASDELAFKVGNGLSAFSQLPLHTSSTSALYNVDLVSQSTKKIDVNGEVWIRSAATDAWTKADSIALSSDVDSKIDNVVGNINSALDNINGEII